MELTESQATGVGTIVQGVQNGEQLLVCAGAAGTGKTTILNRVVQECRELGKSVLVCTPTNKAAQVLISKGIPAQTFFKTFYILEETKRRGVKPRFISCKRYLEETGAKYLPEGKYDYIDVLIIDEASMVTSDRAHDMLRMCGTLILVGDRHQLPPVGDGRNPAGFFATLRPTVELTEVMRQAEGSMILQLATEIRNDSPKVDRALRFFTPEDDFESWVHRDAKMICYTNKERRRINQVVRRILGFNAPHPMVGDVMICTSNYSDDLVNGTECRVTAFDWSGADKRKAFVSLDTGMATVHTKMSMLVFAEDQVVSQQNALIEMGLDPTKEHYDDEEDFCELTFGYCLTAHKAQGSEWPAVCVFDQRGLIRKIAAGDDKIGGMPPDEVVRRWIYTAVTRARQQLAVAPTWWASCAKPAFEVDTPSYPYGAGEAA